jgi:hypothetical protein
MTKSKQKIPTYSLIGKENSGTPLRYLELMYRLNLVVPDSRWFHVASHKFCLMIDCLWWGETVSQNCGHQWACCSSPGDMWAWRAMVMMILAGDDSWLIHQSSLAALPAETSGASRRNGWSEDFAYQYVKYVKGSLTCHKILRHGTCGFTFPPKEGVLRIFVTSAGFEPATLGSSGKDTNHYTTEATCLMIVVIPWFTVVCWLLCCRLALYCF